MEFHGSVSEWIERLKEGEEQALGKLQERYWPWLVNLARKRLKGAPARAADEEDVAQEAFWAFYRNLKAGKFPRLTNRHDLWALLIHIVGCRAVNQIQHEIGVQKRGAGKVHGGSAFEFLPGASEGQVCEPADEDARTPLEQAMLNDCYRQYVECLPDALREFAELHLAGYTNREIADQLQCVERTVERKMALIVKRWQALAVDSLSREWKASA